MRYVPVWTLNELQRCRKLLYSTAPNEMADMKEGDVKVSPFVPETKVDELFNRWGGIARFVLQYALDDFQQRELASAIATKKLLEVVESHDDANVPATVSSKLIHLVATEDFGLDCYRFASEYVADKVFERLLDQKRNDLITFIATSNEIQDLGSLRGALFVLTRTAYPQRTRPESS